MELIFVLSLITSIILLITKNVSLVLTTMQSACVDAVELSIKLISIYALWLGLLEIVQKSGLSQKLAKLLRPLTNKLFKFNDSETEELVVLNLSSNILGMGNASTPSGVQAMQKFDDGTGKINKNMIMLFLLNSCSLQVIPSTIIGLRVNYGSQSASNILLPNLFASFLTTILAVFICLLIEKVKNKKGRNK